MGITKLDLKQNFYNVNLIIKNLVVEKDKLSPNETAILCVPQVRRFPLLISRVRSRSPPVSSSTATRS
ncbi:MAG: hypothetical protein P4M11_13020 [Candidatus Pacebacteria bacterium]|nr:hypothetical protein [Candidatus Paceibacterota bacterium]